MNPTKAGFFEDGAHEWNRTIDLLLTKEVLYRLSYVSKCYGLYEPGCCNGAGDGNRTRASSLEGYSSTIELLPRRMKHFHNRVGTYRL